jgi:acyl dehydratase
VTLDVAAALAARFAAVATTWDTDRVILYHLGVGAAAGGIDDRSLRLVWEDRLRVLPTFAIVPGSDAARIVSQHPSIAGDPSRMLQGSHEVTVHRPLPRAATAWTEARVEQVSDTGSSALVTICATTRNETDEVLATNRFTLLLRGAGGFGGDPPERRTRVETSLRPLPELRCPTCPQQTALYRLSGDRTPLHIDPATAAFAGFAAPPLPGVCTLGTIAQRFVEDRLDGDPSALRGVRGRFSGPVYPGETLRLQISGGEHEFHFDAWVEERGTQAIAEGALTVV